MLFAKVDNPNNGYDHDVAAVAKLDHNKYYEVQYIEIGVPVLHFVLTMIISIITLLILNFTNKH